MKKSDLYLQIKSNNFNKFYELLKKNASFDKELPKSS